MPADDFDDRMIEVTRSMVGVGDADLGRCALTIVVGPERPFAGRVLMPALRVDRVHAPHHAVDRWSTYRMVAFPRETRVRSGACNRAALNAGFTMGALFGGIALATGSLMVTRFIGACSRS